MVPILKVTRQPPDNVDDYRQEFGYLGPALHAAVSRARSQATTPAASSTGITSAAGSILIQEISCKISRSLNLGGGLLSAGRGTIMMSGTSTTKTARNQSGAAASPANPTKYMFVTSRPSTPVQVYSKNI